MAIGRQFSAVAALAVALWAVPSGAQARDFPNRPAHIIVPFDDGGGTPEQFTALWTATAKPFGAVVQQRHITVQ